MEYRIKAPDGSMVRGTAPDGATDEEIMAHVQANWKPEQAPSADKAIDVDANVKKALTDDLQSLPWIDRQVAGIGATLNNVTQRIKQVNGANNENRIRINRAMQDEGPWGAAVPMLATAAIPGVNTVAGGAALGALSGAAQPTLDDESTWGNAALGGTVGGVASAATNLIPGLVKSLVRPFYKGGQEQIVGETLKQFGAVPGALRSAKTPGWNPTLAEATGNSGIATLERGAASKSPILGKLLEERRLSQNQAAVDALEGIGSGLDAAKQARRAASEPLYKQAAADGLASPGSFGQYWPEMEGQIQDFLKRPAASKALAKAKEIFGNEGLKFDKQEGSVRGLQYMKQAFDDLIEKSRSNTSSIGKHERRAMEQSRSDLVGMIQTLSPVQRQADETFARLSQPVNEKQIGQYLQNRLTPAITDFQEGNPSRLLPNQFATALRERDAMARKATGYAGASYDSAMSQGAKDTVKGLAGDLANRAKMADGRGVGSNTAQNLASQQLLSRTMGAVGVPGDWANAFASSPLAQTAMRPVSWVAKVPEERIQAMLAEALLDPQKANAILSAGGPSRIKAELIRVLQNAPVPLALTASQQISQQ